MKSIQVKYQPAREKTNSKEKATFVNNQLDRNDQIEKIKELEYDIVKLEKAIANLLLTIEK